MSSDNIYFEILNYEESDDSNWFGYAWNSIEEGEFEDVELLLEELDSRKEELGDLEISLLVEIFREYDESDLRDYTVSLAKEYDVRDEGPANSFA